MELTIRTQTPVASPISPSLRRRLSAAADALLREAGRPDAEVSLLLTGDTAIHALNRTWRGVDKPTDVLSWPQEEPARADGAEDLLGDVVISVETARRQAETREWDVDEEIALLLVHGMLHLLGHEDETEAGARGMEDRERRILGKPLTKIEVRDRSA